MPEAPQAKKEQINDEQNTADNAGSDSETQAAESGAGDQAPPPPGSVSTVIIQEPPAPEAVHYGPGGINPPAAAEDHQRADYAPFEW